MQYKVIFVPGVPGSRLHEVGTAGAVGKKVFPPHVFSALHLTAELKAKLEGPNDLATPDGIVAGEPIASTRLLGLDLTKQASDLYRILRQCGLDDREIAKVGWDWRRPVTDPDTLRRLDEHLARAAPGVVVIAHSTGGLVVRHFLENHPAAAAKVARVIGFGIPWAGSLKALATLTGQQSFGPIGKQDAQEIFAYAWSAFDLLPRDNSAGLVIDSHGDPMNPLTRFDWMPAAYKEVMQARARHSRSHLGPHRRTWQPSGIPVTNVVGWGEETHVLARVAGDTVTFNPGLQPEARRLGDGTVPLGSAAWLQGNVTTLMIPIGGYPRSGREPHSTLWRNPGGADIVRHLLRAPSLEEFAYAAVDWSDKLDPSRDTVRIRFVLQGLDGKPLGGGFARLANVPGHKQAGIDAAGRGMITESRHKIPETQDRRFRRVVVELHWPGARRARTQTLLLGPER